MSDLAKVTITVGDDFDGDGELRLSIEDDYCDSVTALLSRDETRQLRDLLSKRLNSAETGARCNQIVIVDQADEAG